MNKTLFVLLGVGFIFLYSCSDSNDYSAYFGGEIVNPKDKWVFFYQGEKLLDSISLDDNNRFFTKFDSLSPGLYRFKHKHEYQYIYFDKNDSLMVRVNTNSFDESLWFCGKGDEKNNFLIEVYLKNIHDRETILDNFDSKKDNFIQKADSSYREMLKFYTAKKEDIKWNNDFDIFAKASVDYPYYSKKELYPVIYKKQTTKTQQLSPIFYNYRKNVDFDNEKLSDFEVYIQYVNFAVDNIVNYQNNFDETDVSNALKKIEIIDSVTKNQSLKNRIANHIAYNYLLENKKNASDTIFIKKYVQISTDIEKRNKIVHIAQSILNSPQTERLPNIDESKKQSECK